MSDTSLKKIVGQKKDLTEEIYDLLWEFVGIAIACSVVWLMSLLV